MGKKYVAVCDHCRAEAPLRDNVHGDLPVGWLMVAPVTGRSVEINPEMADLCSWDCVARYAIDRQTALDRRERELTRG